MDTLVIYHPQCKFINGAFTRTVSKKVFCRDSKSKWVSLSPKKEEISIIPVTPIGYEDKAAYLTEAGALSHPHWMYEYNDKGYQKLHPVWDVEDFPGMVDLEKNFYYPVTLIDGKLVEVGRSNPKLYTPYSTDVTEWKTNVEIAIEAMKAPNPDAAVQLLGLIIDINKKCLSAKWVGEYEWELLGMLAAARNSPGIPQRHTEYGDSCITATCMADLYRLQKQSNGWWIHDSDNGAFLFIVSR
ncbi:hypothetical protein CAL7716_102690 (plasmid) [Calothrix sp. PCC 7716]|nr:hypothetical protein CAL7716_102690 [Calothrix sp. PCC 7716]